MKSNFLTFLFVISYLIGYSQSDNSSNAIEQLTEKLLTEAERSPSGHIRCFTDESNYIQQVKNGSLNQINTLVNKKYEEFKKNIKSKNNKKIILTIPVVVHVIHNGDPINTSGTTSNENISDAQVLSQIQVLNEDYRKMFGTPGHNTHPDGADVEVEFCMAQIDPSGNPTNGIDRVNMGQSTWTKSQVDQTVKPSTYWDPDQYCNFWTVKFGGSSASLLGYAQFPESTLQGMSTATQPANTDGVVMNYNAFGSLNHDDGSFTLNSTYNLGRTTTHELGHFFGLRHIWGDGNCSASDYCADTPNASSSNFGCPNQNTCTDNINGSDPNDMVENYMDYTDDNCMNIFTEDQKTRILFVLANSPRRALLPNSTACNLTPNNDDAGVSNIITPNGSYCATTVTPEITLKNYGANALTAVTINYQVGSGTIQTQNWNGNLAAGATTNVTLGNVNVSGNTSFTAYTSSPNGVTDNNPNNDSYTSSYSYSSPISTFPKLWKFEGFSTCATTSDCGTTICNLASGWVNETNGTQDDIDWRTDEGGTPSNNTGPTVDYNPGTSTGNYLYLEASGNPVCSGKQANMISPCIDLTSLTNPQLTFAYHMSGASMGDLHVDVYSNGTWTNDVTPVISGDQGTNWLTRIVNLSSFQGNIINIRFRGVTGNNWASDMAIDAVNIDGTPLTSIESYTAENNVSISPNPSNGIFVLKSAYDATVSVYNTLGEQISTKKVLAKKSTTLDLSNQSNGIYFVYVNSNNGNQIKKIVVSK